MTPIAASFQQMNTDRNLKGIFGGGECRGDRKFEVRVKKGVHAQTCKIQFHLAVPVTYFKVLNVNVSEVTCARAYVARAPPCPEMCI